jgi:hypothetical protein
VNQTVERLANFLDIIGELIALFLTCETQLVSDNQMRLKFHQGTPCDQQEMNLILSRSPSPPFSNVGGHRRGGPGNLTGEPKLLGVRKVTRRFVHFNGQLYGFLPDRKLLVIIHYGPLPLP